MTAPALGSSTSGAKTASSVSENDTAAYTSPFYQEMAERWKLCRDVYTGTEALRDNAAEYLVQAPAETDAEFAARVARTELFPAFKITVKGLTGMVARKDPEPQDDVPADLKLLWENIDGIGTHGAVFVRRVFADAMIVGQAGILVDMPVKAETQKLSPDQEKAKGYRPYWVHIKAEQVINWHTEIVGGREILTLLVIKQITTEPAGEFATITVTRFRVFRRDVETDVVSFYIFTWGGDHSNPELESSGTLQNVRGIPFTMIYTGDRPALLQSTPPLLDLAYTNIAHAQVLSDRRTGLHMVGSPITVFKDRIIPPAKLDEDPDDPNQAREQVVGGAWGVDVGPNGDVKIVEHQGHALGELREELRDIEKRMASEGLAMLQADTRAAETAEAKRIDKSQQDASLSSAARSEQDAIEEAAAWTAQFMGLKTGGSWEVSRDFESLSVDSLTIDSYSKMVLNGQLSLGTFWTILQNAGKLPEEMDHELEKERILAGTAVTPADSGNPSGGTAADDTALGTAVGDAGAGPVAPTA